MANQPQNINPKLIIDIDKINRPVPNLNPIPEINQLKEFNNFNPFFKELLIGILLGDGSIPNNYVNLNSKTARIRYSQSPEKREQYIDSVFNEFKNNGFISSKDQTEPKTQTRSSGFGKGELQSYFYTRYDQSFYQMYLKFYSDRKVVPKTIRQDLSAISLAYWFSDNGSRKNPTGTGFEIATQAFSIYEVFILCDVLRRKFNIMAWPQQTKAIDVTRVKQQGINDPRIYDPKYRYYSIFISGSCFRQVEKLIYQYLHPDILKTKWPAPKNPDGTETTRRIPEIKVGRYKRTVDLTGKKAGKVVVTEQILNFDLDKVEYEIQLTISKNNTILYLQEYNKSPPLNLNPLFKGWD